MQNENAAEVAKAKEAARAVLLEERAMRQIEMDGELEHIMFEQSEFLTQVEVLNFDIENLKSSLGFATDDTERD